MGPIQDWITPVTCVSSEIMLDVISMVFVEEQLGKDFLYLFILQRGR